MSDVCEHFGETSEELDETEGMTWILEHCESCPIWKKCLQAEYRNTSEEAIKRRDEK